MPGTASRADCLVLFIEPNDRRVLDYCDNLNASPWGELVVRENDDGQQYIRIPGADGAVSTFARLAANPEGEFAGVCFSSDREAMFVNLKETGITVAILPLRRSRRRT